MNPCGSKSPSQRKQKRKRRLSSSLNASKTLKECGLNSFVNSFSSKASQDKSNPCQDKTLLEQDNSYMESLRLDNETNDFLPNNASSPKKNFYDIFQILKGLCPTSRGFRPKSQKGLTPIFSESLIDFMISDIIFFF